MIEVFVSTGAKVPLLPKLRSTAINPVKLCRIVMTWAFVSPAQTNTAGAETRGNHCTRFLGGTDIVSLPYV